MMERKITLFLLAMLAIRVQDMLCYDLFTLPIRLSGGWCGTTPRCAQHAPVTSQIVLQSRKRPAQRQCQTCRFAVSITTMYKLGIPEPCGAECETKMSFCLTQVGVV